MLLIQFTHWNAHILSNLVVNSDMEIKQVDNKGKRMPRTISL
jgi:hypothetical protein